MGQHWSLPTQIKQSDNWNCMSSSQTISFCNAAGVQVQADSPVRPSHLTTGARRSFFCRMKHSRVAGKHEDKPSLLSTSKKKGEGGLEARQGEGVSRYPMIWFDQINTFPLLSTKTQEVA